MKIHHKIADWFGYDLLRKEKSDRTLNQHLCRLIESKSSSSACIFDIGANEGQFGKSMRRAGYKGMIYSFEPVPSVYDKLVKTASGDANWKVFCFALGDKAEKAEINTPVNSTDFSSLLKNNKYSESRFEKHFKGIITEEVEVKVLDQFLTERQLELTGFDNFILKLDTQGYDLNVLRGSKKFLDKVDIIVTELSFIQIYEGMPSFIETSAFLKDQGFTPTAFFPITRDKNSLAIIEMDGVFIKK